MPNHVKTVIVMKNIPNEKTRDFLMNTLTAEVEYTKDKILDFDKVIPEPQIEEECEDRYKVNKDSHVAVYEDRPWFNWYDWHLAHWNTKWGAYNGYTVQSKSKLRFVFSTAWSPAMPIFLELAVWNLDMEIYYADEDWGHNCGKLIYHADTGKWESYSEEALTNPRDFAKRLWDRW